MLRRAASYYPLAITVLFGLLVSFLPVSPVLGDNIGACPGLTASSATVKLGGREIPPNQILLANGGQPCDAGVPKFYLVSMSHTLVVSPTGTSTQNGAALLSAMITISNSNPSVDNPWLLKVEPGNYYLGKQSLTLKPYVDLEGSGEDTTSISSDMGGNGTLVMASNSEARFVSIVTAGPIFSTAIVVPVNITNAHLTHVTASGSATGSPSQAYGLYNYGGTITLQNCTLLATAYSSSSGIYNETGTTTVQESTLSASGAVYNYGLSNNNGTFNLQHSNVSATGGTNSYAVNNTKTLTVQESALTASSSNTNYALFSSGNATVHASQLTASGGSVSYGLNSGGGKTQIGASQLSGGNGPTWTSSTGMTCVASYNGSFTPVNALCQ
ncbi:MAG TPA: hypothetical protein VH186_01090 [Chloroflexia bacterium]|nr:hypothetical protein [Chloroflexia bacterium]